MDAYGLILGVTSSILEAVIIVRAARGRFLSEFSLFYSYLAYVFTGSVTCYYVIRRFWPQYYANFYWFYFVVALLAEFAILTEISDHIFKPYPTIRRFGRLLAITISAGFFFLYIFPALTEHKPSSAAFLDFAKRASITKAFIIVALLAVVRNYRLPLGRYTSGMLLGFAIYLGVSVANFAAAGQFGKALYADVLGLLFPLSYTVCLLVWTVTLWHYEPALPESQAISLSRENSLARLGIELQRFNAVLTRLFER